MNKDYLQAIFLFFSSMSISVLVSVIYYLLLLLSYLFHLYQSSPWPRFPCLGSLCFLCIILRSFINFLFSFYVNLHPTIFFSFFFNLRIVSSLGSGYRIFCFSLFSVTYKTFYFSPLFLWYRIPLIIFFSFFLNLRITSSLGSGYCTSYFLLSSVFQDLLLLFSSSYVNLHQLSPFLPFVNLPSIPFLCLWSISPFGPVQLSRTFYFYFFSSSVNLHSLISLSFFVNLPIICSLVSGQCTPRLLVISSITYKPLCFSL